MTKNGKIWTQSKNLNCKLYLKIPYICNIKKFKTILLPLETM